MRQDAQKQSRKFCRSKEGKNSETHPEKPEKGETGCVLGAGAGGSGWERIKPGAKTRSPNQNEPQNHATHEKRKPAKTQCFRRFFGRGRRTWFRLPPRSVRGRAPLALARPTTRTAQGAAAPRCQNIPPANEKSQIPQKRYLTFWQGQKDSNPRHAVLEWMWENASTSGRRSVLPGSLGQVPEEGC